MWEQLETIPVNVVSCFFSTSPSSLEMVYRLLGNDDTEKVNILLINNNNGDDDDVGGGGGSIIEL